MLKFIRDLYNPSDNRRHISLNTSICKQVIGCDHTTCFVRHLRQNIKDKEELLHTLQKENENLKNIKEDMEKKQKITSQIMQQKNNMLYEMRTTIFYYEQKRKRKYTI